MGKIRVYQFAKLLKISVDEAIDLLVRSVDFGLTQRGWFEHDNNLDPLREHPRFRALMERFSDPKMLRQWRRWVEETLARSRRDGEARGPCGACWS